MLTTKQIKKIELTIDEFLITASKKFSNYHIEHVSFGSLHTYFGVGNYVRMYPLAENGSIVVASVDIDEDKQGKGYFKSFYNKIEEIAEEKNMRIVFESVINPRLEEWLKTKGYNLYPGGSYYKDIKEYKIENDKQILMENIKENNKKVKYE